MAEATARFEATMAFALKKASFDVIKSNTVTFLLIPVSFRCGFGSGRIRLYQGRWGCQPEEIRMGFCLCF